MNILDKTVFAELMLTEIHAHPLIFLIISLTTNETLEFNLIVFLLHFFPLFLSYNLLLPYVILLSNCLNVISIKRLRDQFIGDHRLAFAFEIC